MGTLVTYELEGSVAMIAMDDGKANVLSLPMLAELNAALDQAEAANAVVMLTGRDGMFSAGFDLGVLRAGDDAAAMLNGGFHLAARLLAFPTPVLVVCTGHAIAMGVFLLLSGDYRLGADGPYKIIANEVALGLTMPWAAIEICRQRLTPAHFHRVVALSELYTPATAVDAGLLDRAVPPSDLLDVARSTAETLAALDMRAHAATKLRVRDDALRAIRVAIDLDDAAFRALQSG
jgi:enoyl-CoA hydratase